MLSVKMMSVKEHAADQARCFRRAGASTRDLLRDAFCVEARVGMSRHHLRPHIHYLP